jgi:hypothetical protein
MTHVFLMLLTFISRTSDRHGDQWRAGWFFITLFSGERSSEGPRLYLEPRDPRPPAPSRGIGVLQP